MRRLIFVLCLILILSACGSRPNPREQALLLRERYAGLESIDMTINVRADYGDRVYDYKLSYNGDIGSGRLRVLGPESIAGMTAEYSEGGTALVFDSTELYTGEIDESGLSPLDAVPASLKAWAEGYIRESWYERLGDYDCIVILTDINDDVQLYTWFELDSMLPVQADVMSDGHTAVSMKYENVILNE